MSDLSEAYEENVHLHKKLATVAGFVGEGQGLLRILVINHKLSVYELDAVNEYLDRVDEFYDVVPRCKIEG